VHLSGKSDRRTTNQSPTISARRVGGVTTMSIRRSRHGVPGRVRNIAFLESLADRSLILEMRFRTIPGADLCPMALLTTPRNLSQPVFLGVACVSFTGKTENSSCKRGRDVSFTWCETHDLGGRCGWCVGWRMESSRAAAGCRGGWRTRSRSSDPGGRVRRVRRAGQRRAESVSND
jgi:hypothetical protein